MQVDTNLIQIYSYLIQTRKKYIGFMLYSQIFSGGVRISIWGAISKTYVSFVNYKNVGF